MTAPTEGHRSQASKLEQAAKIILKTVNTANPFAIKDLR
jgi:hypothetical protein